MSENKHTNEPWPHFTDIATTMTPDPEGTPVAILSWDDYIRARACVNACAGIDTDQLETGSINKSLQMFALESATYRRQRDELLADAERYRFLRNWWFNGPEGDIRRALCPEELDQAIDSARAKGDECKYCNGKGTSQISDPCICQYGAKANHSEQPLEMVETSAPAIVFYPAGSLGEEVQS